MPRPAVTSVKLIRRDEPEIPREDIVATEEPLEIRLEFGRTENREQIKLAVTMRTPGKDLDLATGFLFTEGIIQSVHDIISIRYCESVKNELEKENVVKALLEPGVSFSREQLQRNFFATSSCGVCGKGSLEAVKVACKMIDSGVSIHADVINRSTAVLRESQRVFEYTGGLHAAGLFSADGKLLAMAEDVGRHNALDKLIGGLLHDPAIFNNSFVVLSGRASFELVQKAARAGIPVIAAVSAPSSLAVSLADEIGITLLGFVRNNSFNCYSHKNRIQ